MRYVETGINKQSILDLKEKLIKQENEQITEEATKQWYILPLFVALGYDPYSSDILPEYTADVGTKRGEKVDYAIQIDNKPVFIVECKQLGATLSESHISQLYRYFTVTDVHIGVLTNGNDYWFFTDSKKENIMDLEPYLKIRISDISESDIVTLLAYSKSRVNKLNVAYTLKCEKYKEKSKDFVIDLLFREPPNWLTFAIAKLSGIGENSINQEDMVEYFVAGLEQAMFEFTGISAIDMPDDTSTASTNVANTLFTGETSQPNQASDIKQEKPKPSLQIEQPNESDILQSKPTDSTKVSTDTNISLGDKMRQTRARNMEQKSNIKLHHEYVYNDYTDGDWRFHSMDYAVIFGVIYENMSGRKLLITVIDEILRRQYVDKEDLIAEEMFNGTYKIGRGTGKNEVRKAHYFEKYNMYVATSFGIGDIIKFIEKLLQFSHLPNSSVKISFKE